MKRYIKGYYCPSETELFDLNKDSNREILIALRKAYPQALNVTELAKQTGIPEKTVYAQVAELYNDGFIEEIKTNVRKRGRPSAESVTKERASRFVFEDMNRLFNGASDFSYSFAPGSVHYPRGFLETWHELVTDDEDHELCLSLIAFIEKVLRRAAESDNKKIMKWAPTLKIEFCCSQCGLNHEVRDFIRATLIHLIDHIELEKGFYELLKKNQSITEETYKEVLEGLEKEETEEEELDEEEEEF